LEEAQATVDLWYAARKEVKLWQQARHEEARKTGHVRTLLGRRRRLPEINDRSRLKRSHMERAAINTPVQVRSNRRHPTGERARLECRG
jgi:DNA polymerase-1